MEQQELRTLKILEAVEEEESPSQRELARRLNVSLGLVNSFIKRLVNKGYFKVTTIPKNRVKYMLTPKGMTEKTRLTYEYIQFSVRFYREAREKLKRLIYDLETEGVRKLAFYGAGELAEIAYISLQGSSLILCAIFDDSKKNGKFFGRFIQSSDSLSDSNFDKILITEAEGADLIMSRLIEIGVPINKIAVIE